MTSFALLLVLIAAVLHATWNYCAKRAGGGLPFVWTVGAVICLCSLPVLAAYCAWASPTLSGTALLWIFGSGILKTSYTLFLQRGYCTGDFSLIYPLARGTGPLLSTLGAVLLFGERPPPLATAGGLVIIVSIFWLTGGFAKVGAMLRRGPPAGTLNPATAANAGSVAYSSFNYGLISGVFIASYTLWDQHGVASLAIAPLLYDGGTSFTQLLLLSPSAWRRRGEVRAEWHQHKRWIFGVALLSPAAYLLVLTAMKFTPVSYIAPAREVSIVIGAFIGAKFLKEADGHRRIIAAVAMTAGVIALALA